MEEKGKVKLQKCTRILAQAWENLQELFISDEVIPRALGVKQ